MSYKFPKNFLTGALIVFALVIWGHNGYKFVRGFQSPYETPASVQPVSGLNTMLFKDTQKETSWVYESKYRDPFINQITGNKRARKKVDNKPKVAKNAVKQEVRLPKLRFAGIIKDFERPLAIIEDMHREVFFVDLGDSVAGVRIMSIDSNKVSCQYKTKKFTLMLSR